MPSDAKPGETSTPVEPQGSAALLPVVYAELRRLAAAQLSRQRPGHTLQPTALVHEAFLKLVKGGDPQWQNRGHFFAAATLAMREIIVDGARRRAAVKRGGGRARTTLDGLTHAGEAADLDEVLAVDDALRRLEAAHPRAARGVAMRYFAGLSEEEIAAALEITTRTVERDWRFARAWLHQVLAEGAP